MKKGNTMRCGMHRQLIIRQSEQIFMKYIGHTMRNVELYLMEWYTVNVVVRDKCEIYEKTEGDSYETRYS